MRPYYVQVKNALPSKRTDLLLLVVIQGVAHAARDYTSIARVNV